MVFDPRSSPISAPEAVWKIYSRTATAISFPFRCPPNSSRALAAAAPESEAERQRGFRAIDKPAAGRNYCACMGMGMTHG
jgi:hypothetical protein